VSHLHSLQSYTPIFHSWHLHVFTLRNLTANCMPPHSLRNWTVIEVEVTLRVTVSQSVSLGVEPHLGLMIDIYCCLTVTVLFLWGALSDKRTGLSFVYAAGHCQRSLSWVKVPWDSRPYFTVSNLRLPFSSPPTTRRVTVKVFDPASTQVSELLEQSRAEQ
jgi:hypothetical protein